MKTPMRCIMLIVILMMMMSNINAQFVHTQGTKILDKNGAELQFTGMNLGNWLVWEGYLMMGEFGFKTHTQFYNGVKGAFGGNQAQADDFLHQWRMNYVTNQTIVDLKALGFNSVRVPFHYNMFWNGSAVTDQGFQYFDRLIEYCKANGVHILLDMHAAPGAQNPGDHSDNNLSNDTQPRNSVLFWDANNINIATQVWKHIATHYANEPTIWGYDLLNEPVTQAGREYELLTSYVTMKNAIRTVDANHIIVAEGDWWASDMQKIDWLDATTQSKTGITSKWDTNLVYETHHYVFGDESGISLLDGRKAVSDKLNVPLIFGEYGEDSESVIRKMTDWAINNNVGYFPWTFKKISFGNCLWTVPSNSAFDNLRSYIKNGGTPPANAYNDLIAYCNNNIANGKPGVVFNTGFYNAVKRNAPLPPAQIPGTIEAEAFKTQSGIQTETTTDTGGGQNVGFVDAGDWLDYSVDVKTAGTYQVQFRVASASTTGQIQLMSGTSVLATVNVPNTGGWQVWTTISTTASLNAGLQTLRLNFSGAGLNLNWISFTTTTANVSVTGVTVSPTSATLAVGATQQLTPTVSPSNATNKNVTYSSSNAAVASVNSSGLITGVAAGSATITVTTVDGGKTATVAVTVTNSVVAVTGVTVSPTTATLSVGGTQQLTPTVSPSNATNKNVTYSSSNASVASVNASGLITGVAAGSATITVTTVDGGKTATVSVTVTNTNVAVTSVTISPTSATLSVGGTQQLTATVSPVNATNKNVTYSSSAPSVATVSATGLVTAVAVGTAVITVTTVDQAKTAQSTITVITNSGALANGTYKILSRNSGKALDVKDVSTSNGALIQQWADNGGNNQKWTVTDLGNGYYKIISVLSGKSLDVKDVSAEDRALIQQWDYQGNNNQQWQINSLTGGYYNVISKFSGKALDVQNNSTADGALIQQLTYSGANNQQWSFIKLDGNVAVTGVTVSPTSVSLTVGTTQQLTPTVSPSNATNKNVSYSSSNTSIVTVNASGLVTAIAAGSATITVTTQDGAKTATTTVTVTSGSIAVTGVTVSPTSASLSVGGTQQLTATVAPGNATNKTVTWASSNTSVATVNASGLVTAIAAGSATITVTTQDGAKTASSSITVTSGNVAVTGVSISPGNFTMGVGATTQLTATVAPSNATNKNVTWTSSNTAVATVSASGLVTAKANGTATITVTTADGNKTASVVATINTVSGNFSVNVTISSEKSPKDVAWYKAPMPIDYKLAAQPNLTITQPGNSFITAIDVNPATQYQTIYGIGSSFEETTVYNLMRMSATTRQSVLRQLVDPANGIGMNLFRICIGTSDFTGRPWYSYVDVEDRTLNSFSIQKDKDYNIIKVIKEAQALNSNIRFFATPWSPPGWMKTSGVMTGGTLKDDMYELCAKYYAKFIKAYEAEGIPIYAMTVQNEPGHDTGDMPSMGLTWQQELRLVKAIKAEFVAQGITTKIWIHDHNMDDAMTNPANILADAGGYAAADGTGFHDYGGEPTEMTKLHNMFPNKEIFFTERSVWGTEGMDRIAQYFRNWACTYNSWVTMIDQNNDPNNGPFFADPTLFVKEVATSDGYWAIPEYYLTGQYSKFIKVGAKRVDSSLGKAGTLTNVTFRNPDGQLVMVVINLSATAQKFKVKCEGNQFIATLPAKTVGTYTWASGLPLSPNPSTDVAKPPVAAGNYYIQSVENGKVLTAASTGDVTQSTNTQSTTQQWKLSINADFTYKVESVSSAKAMAVAGASVANGAKIAHLAFVSGDKNQEWIIDSVGVNTYAITNLNSSLSLDITDHSTSDGTIIQQWGYSGGANQQWKFIGTAAARVEQESIEFNSKSFSAHISPNPGKGQMFNVRLNEKPKAEVIVSITDLMGKELEAKSFTEQEFEFYLRNPLKAGVYLVRIGKQTKRLVVE